MRIRSTKPEFWRSKTIAALSWDVRLVLKGLESYVDDNGVGKDDIALIAADVFPRDLSASPRDTLARLSGALQNLSEGNLVARYKIGGEDLLYIRRWKDLQRIDKPGKGRWSRPDGTREYADEVDESIGAGQRHCGPNESPQGGSSSRDTLGSPRETVASPPEKVAPVTGEQGNSGTEEKGRTTSSDKSDHTQSPDRFDEFWETYGNKVGRAKSETAYRNALKKPGVTAELLVATAAAYVIWCRNNDTFIKNPLTWLHGEHWRDERADIRAPVTNVQRHLQLAAELAEQERGPQGPQPRQIGGPA